MPFDVNEKEVFPVLPFRWPALDLAHAELEAVEGLDCTIKRADTILNAEH